MINRRDYSIYNGKIYHVEYINDYVYLMSKTKDEGFEEFIDRDGEIWDGVYYMKFSNENAPLIYRKKYYAKYAERFLPVKFKKKDDYRLELDADTDFEFGKANDFERYENLFYRKYVSPEEVDELKIEEYLYDKANSKTEKIGETIIPKENIREWLDENYQ